MKVGEYVLFVGITNNFYTNNKFYKIYEIEKIPHIKYQFIIDDKNMQIKIDLDENKLNKNWQYISKKKYREIKLETIKNIKTTIDDI